VLIPLLGPHAQELNFGFYTLPDPPSDCVWKKDCTDDTLAKIFQTMLVQAKKYIKTKKNIKMAENEY
jgi:hypothetical protein